MVFSAAKLFFAYGLGNALTFPFWAGATVVLLAERPTAESVCGVIDIHHPTIFFAVPTLYSMMLNQGCLPDRDQLRIRHCVSAGEALPENIQARWKDELGLDILDSIGSTEMLHMFMCNRPDQVRPGSSGKPLDGFELQLLDDTGQTVADGEIGDLYVKGPTAAIGYWNRRAQSIDTFRGVWVRTGDKYFIDADGYYIYCGRSDDLLKVGGIYVSPMEVENTLLGHPLVAEAAVVAGKDSDDLVKPKAYVVLKDRQAPGEDTVNELIEYTRSKLADFKRPRWVEFIDELPKTATGKIQRFKLRS